MKLTAYPLCPGNYDPEKFGSSIARRSRSTEKLLDLLKSDKNASEIFKYLDFGHSSLSDNVYCAVDFEDITMLEAALVWFNISRGGGTENSTRYLNLGSLNKTDKLDKIRYSIPVNTLTSMTIITDDREWADVTRFLLSHYSEQVRNLGEELASLLSEIFPESYRHFRADPEKEEFERLKKLASTNKIVKKEQGVELLVKPELFMNPSSRYPVYPRNEKQAEISKIDPIVWAFTNITVAELRDVNRHRSGNRSILWCPTGFWSATESQMEEGLAKTEEARQALLSGDTEWCFKLLLGSQLEGITRSTYMNYALYEIQLRTEKAAHFKYKEAYLDLAKQIGLEIKEN